MPNVHQPSLRYWSLIACAFIATLSLAQTSVVEKHGRLSVEGNRIVDQTGDAVVLRGMSLYWSQWKGGFYNRNTETPLSTSSKRCSRNSPASPRHPCCLPRQASSRLRHNSSHRPVYGYIRRTLSRWLAAHKPRSWQSCDIS